MAHQYKRRLIPIIDRRFQFKYTGIIVAIAAVISAALGYFLLQSYLEMNEVINLASLSPEVSEKLNSDDARFVFKITIGFLVIEVAVLGVMGLLITHRVCGPIFVLTRHFTTIKNGNYPSMRPLRSGDEFVEAFDAFSQAVEALKQRDGDDLQHLKAVRDAAKGGALSAAEIEKLDKLIADREARVGAK